MSTFIRDEEFLPAAKGLISKASKSIYISTFKAEITSKRRGEKLKELFDLLISKAGDGVDVRLLTNRKDNRGHVPDSNAFALRFLKTTKLKVRHLPNDRLVHAKILIVDRVKAIVGSHNLSVKSCHNNFELSCFLADVVPVTYLACYFEDIWDKAKET
jgi:phosphatidylserine/phosphatidylglycerophosphate/cardiolipin synthase-like enzyme